MSNKRISGRALQALRKQHFQRQPLCELCAAKGIVRTAEELDHINPLSREPGPDRLDLPRRGLCRECHREATRQAFGYRRKPRIGLDGWEVDDE
ncbi:MAG: HNH endonuclease [Burkholderiaceae bacterium]|nr:HNH endonuclease [Burkholderiaceae bacterium]